MNKYYYRTAGYAFMFIGLITTMASVYLYVFPKQQMDLETVKDQKLTQCEAIGKDMGYEVSRNANVTITFRKESFVSGPNASDPNLELLNTSLISSRCEGMQLAYFCMGTECEMNEVSVEMTLKSNITF